VEDCVNAVGVDVNTASAPLLARVSGVGEWVAQNIVAHRNENGPFRARRALKDVMGLGPKTFELSAGFLRITDGENPLDASGVHPEAYPVVRRILEATRSDIKVVIGNRAVLQSLRPETFTDETFGVPTVTDILGELEKPGRDPRPEFRTATFQDGVESIGDLTIGMILEGVVTNVAGFGAFVDIGVHQDGLVHISALANTFVKDPRAVVKPGDVVRVKVLEVDKQRKRIALTMRLSDPSDQRSGTAADARRGAPEARNAGSAHRPAQQAGGGALADALRRAAEVKGSGPRN
jgi:protein Tex